MIECAWVLLIVHKLKWVVISGSSKSCSSLVWHFYCSSDVLILTIYLSVRGYVEFILRFSEKLLSYEVVLILTKIINGFSHVLNICLLSIDYIISTCLYVARTLNEPVWCRMVLSTYDDLCRNSRVQFSRILLDFISLRYIWLLTALIVLSRNALTFLGDTVLRYAVGSTTKNSISFATLSL